MEKIYINKIYELAVDSFNKDEIPVGAIVVKNGEVIAQTYNQKEVLQDVTAHAEVLAIRQAQEKLGTFRLKDCEMFVTLEPCPMCAWAILQSGISTIYFGSYNRQYGNASSHSDLYSRPVGR